MVSKMPSSSLSPVETSRIVGYVLVCQNRTCLKQGAAVLAAFQAEPIADYVVLGTGCMGQCGSGPMVRIVPEEIWYSQVLPEEVPSIIQHHLLEGKPVKAMLYPKFHS
ncbi:(2Fe-2S) ferredoxin domain-containing protein [Leptothermofonsia sp. ETS-13]|uniref:(2Fe-2S) ferredoxin domain-containing protein n=1 Tax=Leptothermofonsia sp. ETS-13 TaxID=3035696 RepID=UPI003BA3399C